VEGKDLIELGEFGPGQPDGWHCPGLFEVCPDGPRCPARAAACQGLILVEYRGTWQRGCLHPGFVIIPGVDGPIAVNLDQVSRVTRLDN